MKIAKGIVVKPAGKVFETKYGDKQMMVVQMENGTEEKFYVKPNSPQTFAQLNEPVSVVYELRNGKETRRLVLEEGNNAQLQKQNYTSSSSSYPSNSHNNSRNSYSTPKQPTVEPKEWARSEAKNVAALMNTVSQELANSGFPEMDLEDLRTIAISIYISAQRKFPQGFDLTEPEKLSENEEKPSSPQFNDEIVF